jgi:hypothetical protein
MRSVCAIIFWLTVAANSLAAQALSKGDQINSASSVLTKGDIHHTTVLMKGDLDDQRNQLMVTGFQITKGDDAPRIGEELKKGDSARLNATNGIPAADTNGGDEIPSVSETGRPWIIKGDDLSDDPRLRVFVAKGDIIQMPASQEFAKGDVRVGLGTGDVAANPSSPGLIKGDRISEIAGASRFVPLDKGDASSALLHLTPIKGDIFEWRDLKKGDSPRPPPDR